MPTATGREVPAQAAPALVSQSGPLDQVPALEASDSLLVSSAAASTPGRDSLRNAVESRPSFIPQDHRLFVS